MAFWIDGVWLRNPQESCLGLQRKRRLLISVVERNCVGLSLSSQFLRFETDGGGADHNNRKSFQHPHMVHCCCDLDQKRKITGEDEVVGYRRLPRVFGV